jgi:hypothetical protein
VLAAYIQLPHQPTDQILFLVVLHQQVAGMVVVKTNPEVLIELVVQGVLVAAALILFLVLPLVVLEHLGKVLLVVKVLAALGGLLAAAAALLRVVQITQPQILAVLAVRVLQAVLLVQVLPMLVAVAVAVVLLLVALVVLVVAVLANL